MITNNLHTRHLLTSAFLSSTLIFGCQSSSKDKKSDQNPRSTVIVNQDNDLETYVTSYDIQDDYIEIKYASNNPDAAFECFYTFYDNAAELSLAGSENRFAICHSSKIEINRQDGKELLFQVRAISLGGVKDMTPARLTIPKGEANDSPNENNNEEVDLNLYALTIANKVDKIPETQTSYTFNLVLLKSNQVENQTDGFQFYCKVSSQADYTLCPDGATFTFDNLQANNSYSLFVEAVHKGSGRPLPSHDEVHFKVEGNQPPPPPPPPAPPPVTNDDLVVPHSPVSMSSYPINNRQIRIIAGLYILSANTYSQPNQVKYLQLRSGQSMGYQGHYPGVKQGCSEFATAIEFYSFDSSVDAYYCRGELKNTSGNNPAASLFQESRPAGFIELADTSSFGRQVIIEDMVQAPYFQESQINHLCSQDDLAMAEEFIGYANSVKLNYNHVKVCTEGNRRSTRVNVILSIGSSNVYYSIIASPHSRRDRLTDLSGALIKASEDLARIL